MSLASPRAAAIVRIATGLILLAEGRSQGRRPVRSRRLRGTGAGDRGEGLAPLGRFPALRRASNATAVAWLVAAGELAVGTGLLLGLWTRAACAEGPLLVLTFLLGQFYAPGGSWDDWVTAGLTSKFALLLLALLGIVDAGKSWGIDGRLARGRRRRIT